MYVVAGEFLNARNSHMSTLKISNICMMASDAEGDLASQNPAPNELPPAEAADDAAKSDVGDGQLNSPAMGVATV